MRRREFILAAGAMALSPFSKSRAQGSLGTLVWIESGSLWIRELPDGPVTRLTSAAGLSSPRFSPSGQWIVYQDKDDKKRIVRKDGQAGAALEDARARLSGSDLALLRPDGVFAPDGQRYVFSRVLPDTRVLPDDAAPTPTGQLCLASLSEPDREPEVLVSDDQGEKQVYAWTRDGKSVIYWDGDEWSASAWSDGFGLKSVSIESRIPQDLHVSALADEDMLDIAPSSAGNKLAVTDPAGRETWTSKHVAVVDLDTGTVRHFLPDDVASMCPAWSPDGKHIACFAGPDAVIGYNRARAGETYTVVNPDGTEKTETVKPDDYIGLLGDDAHPYLQQRKIWLLDPEGSRAPRQLTSDYRYRDEEPTWSANGGYILFGRMDYEGHASLWLMDSSGVGAMQVCRLSVADPLTDKEDDGDWFGYYGYIDWRKYFDWRR
jgi:Tol biopolymer transport system component